MPKTVTQAKQAAARSKLWRRTRYGAFALLVSFTESAKNVLPSRPCSRLYNNILGIHLKMVSSKNTLIIPKIGDRHLCVTPITIICRLYHFYSILLPKIFYFVFRHIHNHIYLCRDRCNMSL